MLIVSGSSKGLFFWMWPLPDIGQNIIGVMNRKWRQCPGGGDLVSKVVMVRATFLVGPIQVLVASSLNAELGDFTKIMENTPKYHAQMAKGEKNERKQSSNKVESRQMFIELLKMGIPIREIDDMLTPEIYQMWKQKCGITRKDR